MAFRGIKFKAQCVPAGFAILFTIIIISVAGCDKENNTEVVSSFTWSYNGNNYTARTDTAFLSSWPWSPLIAATINDRLYAPSPEIIINLTSFNTGTYTFTPGGNNIFNYTDLATGFFYNANSGSLQITRYSSSSLDGNFSVNLNSGLPINGSFTNVPVRQ